MANQKLAKSKLRDLLAAEDRLIKAANRILDYLQPAFEGKSFSEPSADEIIVGKDEMELINSASDLLKTRQEIIDVLKG
jgi:hypothetical protein